MLNFKAIFPVILWIFDLECHGQTSLKAALVMFGVVLKKFRKLKSVHRENKRLDFHRFRYFHCLSENYHGTEIVFKILFWIISSHHEVINGSPLTLSWRRSLSYRNQSTDFQNKLMDWFLHDRVHRHERVNQMSG